MWLKISSAQIFWFCNSNVTTFPTSRKCKNFNFSLYTIPAEMLYLQKYLTNFQKLFLAERRLEGGYCGWKFQVHRHFCFCNSNVTTFPTSRKCNNSNFYRFTLVPAEMLYLQKYFRLFKNFLLDERWERWLLRLKFQVHRRFAFAIATLPLFQHSRKCKNSNFSLYTVPAEILYLQRYFTNFQKRFFGWKMMKVAIVVENFKCTDILLLQ